MADTPAAHSSERRIGEAQPLGWLDRPRVASSETLALEPARCCPGSRGIFFGFLIPVAQIPIAAVVAVWLRGNIVAAVSSTLITNPFTFAPIYLVGYRLGAFILGHDDVPMDTVVAQQVAEQASSILVTWSDKFLAVGRPLIVGMSLMAVLGAFIAYFGVLGIWRLFVSYEWRRRHRR